MSVGLGTSLRAWAHRDVRRAWQRRGVLARALVPALWLHWLWRGVRTGARLAGFVRPARLPVPVIVVGNLIVGGAGKTPLVIEVARGLRARGWTPGIVSRGYGGRSPVPLLVDVESDPALCGDEPLMMRAATGAPVAIGRDRLAAGRLLLATHGSCDVIIADDGLQHWRLARDLELVVLNSAGIGNGWLLPAGPLRDPPSRLRSVDAVVLHGVVPPVRIYSPFFRMCSGVGEAVHLVQPSERMTLATLAREQSERKLRVLAICAIGSPERFFGQLREHGLNCTTRALPDHARIEATALERGRFDRILVTEKDAVKCRRDPLLRADERIWVVPLEAQVDKALLDFIEHRLEILPHGRKAAGDPGMSGDQGAAAV